MRNRFLKISLVISLASISTLGLNGCFPIIATGMVGSAMVLADRRPVSVSTIDRGLQLEIESSITQKFGNSAHVNVNVYNQKVLLTGEATTASVRSQIEDEAKKSKNIKSLANEIHVGFLSSMSSRVSDSSLYTLIKAKLIATSDVPSNSMKIVVEGGRVYLMGLVTPLEAKAATSVVSKSSDSIKEVIALFDLISEEERARLDSQSSKPAENDNKASPRN